MDSQTYATAQTVLVDLDLYKVALCDQGANSRANILLTKRKENKNMAKTFDELMTALQPDQATLIKSHIEAIEKTKKDDIDKLNGTITTLKSELATLKEAVGKTKPVEEKPKEDDVTKNASPEVVAYITELQKSVKSLVAAQEEVVAKARFEEVKALPVEEETLKSVLKSASPAVFDILKKAATAVTESVLATKGKDAYNNNFTGTTDSAYATLEKSAKELMKKSASLTFEQAFTEACENDPATYAKYVKGAE